MTVVVEHLSKTIFKKPILSDLNFTLVPGEIVGLVGRNGVGKTTLMRTLVDQYHPDAGRILVDDANLAQVPARRSDLFYLDADGIFFKRWRLTKIAQAFEAAYPAFDMAQYTHLLQRFKLNDQRYGQLSKGYQALVRVALAIASNAEFILFDEPFDGLDVIVRQQIVDLVIDLVADGKRGVLIASHDLRELDGLADRVLMLKHETLIKDIRLEALRQQASKRQMVFAGKTIPDAIKANGHILSIQGRVVIMLFDDYNNTVKAAVAAAKPVLNEALPLQLADLFVSELKEEA